MILQTKTVSNWLPTADHLPCIVSMCLCMCVCHSHTQKYLTTHNSQANQQFCENTDVFHFLLYMQHITRFLANNWPGNSGVWVIGKRQLTDKRNSFTNWLLNRNKMIFYLFITQYTDNRVDLETFFPDILINIFITHFLTPTIQFCVGNMNI